MAKYHINANGDLGVCKSHKGKCPFGGESGTENHYDNIKEATMAFEKRMGNETLPSGLSKTEGGFGGSNIITPKVNRNGVEAKVQKSSKAKATKKIGLRELNNYAKDPDASPEVLMQAAESSSDRVHASLVKNPNAPSEALRLLKNSGDRSISRNAMEHRNYPVNDLNGEEFASTLTRENRSLRLLSNDVNDEHIEALRKIESDNVYSPTFNSVADALSNPTNKVSNEMVEKVLNETPASKSHRNRYIVTNSGKVDIDNYLKNKTAQDINFEALDRSSNQNVLNGVTSWMDKATDDAPELSYSNYKLVQDRLAGNPHMSSENLEKLYGKALKDDNGQLRLDSYREGQLPSTFAKALHANPNTPNAIRSELEEASHYLKTTGRVKRLVESNPNVAEELIVTRNPGKRLNSRGTYNEESFTIDKDKASAYGMNNEMIYELYGKRFNAGVSYDSKTGVITGKVDSSD